MKKNELVAIACLLCFCCCNGTEKEVPNPDLQEELSPIQFTIDLQKEVLPFPVTKSIPELNIPEPISPKSRCRGRSFYTGYRSG